MEEVKAVEKKCPQCGSVVAESAAFCAGCGYKLRDRSEADLTDEEKAKIAEEKARQDERYYAGIKKKLDATMKAVTITQTALYYGIYGLVIVLMLFAMGRFGGKINLNLIGIYSNPLFLVALTFGYTLILTTVDCIGLHIGIKTFKDEKVDVKRFLKVSFARLNKMKSKKNIFNAVEFSGSSLTLKTKSKSKSSNEYSNEARACRLALASLSQFEKGFRVELFVRQLFIIAIGVATVFLYVPVLQLSAGQGYIGALVPMLFVMVMTALSSVPSMLIALPRVRKQEKWYNTAESAKAEAADDLDVSQLLA